MPRPSYSTLAEADLDEIHHYIAVQNQSPAAADSLSMRSAARASHTPVSR